MPPPPPRSLRASSLAVLVGVCTLLLLARSVPPPPPPPAPPLLTPSATIAVPHVLRKHNQYYAEVQGFVIAGLRGLGLNVVTPDWPRCLSRPSSSPKSCAGRVLIVVGFFCNAAYAHSFSKLPPTARVVLFNLEVVSHPPSRSCHNSSAWATHAVWDYAPANIAALRGLGLLAPGGGSNAAAVPLGYYPGIMLGPDVPPSQAPPKPVSVLMIATPNPHRTAIVDALRARGVDVLWPAVGVAGAEKERLLRTARILLNVHYFGEGLLEAVRLFHAVSIGVACVSEDSPDVVASEYWGRAVDLVPYDKLVDHVVELLAAPERVDALARRGYAWMREETASQRVLPALLTALAHLKVEHALQ